MCRNLSARSLRQTAVVAILIASTFAFQQNAAAQSPSGSNDPIGDFQLQPNFDPNARPRRTPRSERVTLDFNKTSLDEVVKMFSSIMGRNFIISDSVNTTKTITIMSPKPVTIREAYRAFLMALQDNGLTIVPAGSFYKIVDSRNAVRQPLKIYSKGDPIPDEARMVTAIIPVENVEVPELIDKISGFLSPEANVVAQGDSIILTESGNNIRRIKTLIRKIDQAGSSSQIFVVRVYNADASEIAQKLKEVFSSSSNNNSSSRNQRRSKQSNNENADSELNVSLSEIISDDRTNQLIIVSDAKSFEKIQDMIEILDVPTSVGGQIHVKFLEYADADELSVTLSALANSSGGNTRQANRRGNRRNSSRGDASNSMELLSGDVQITSYKASNALVVIASPRDFISLESVIDKLDRPQKQVYIEAVIMEVGIDTNRQLGLGFNAGLGKDFNALIPQEAIDNGLISNTSGLVLGQSNYRGIDAALSGAGGALGFIGPMVSIPGTSISLPAFALLLKAVQTDNTANILSTPKILTLNNQEASFVVGERVPFVKGVSSAAGGLASILQGAVGASGAAGGLGGLGGLLGGGALGGLYSNIDYEDVGIQLRILPQVNESNYIRLEVDQEVSDIKGAGGGQTGTPTTTQRKIKTVVIAKDQSTIVIGGLMRDVENETIEKTPILGDIPLLGILFKNKTRIKTKQNLILMLTPYIIESEADIEKIVQRSRDAQAELLKVVGERDINYYKTVNYEKKTGLLDQIRREVTRSLEDAAARKAALESYDNIGPAYRVLGANRNSTSNPQPATPANTNNDTPPSESFNTTNTTEN